MNTPKSDSELVDGEVAWEERGQGSSRRSLQRRSEDLRKEGITVGMWLIVLK